MSNTRWGVPVLDPFNQSTVMMSQYAGRSAGGILLKLGNWPSLILSRTEDVVLGSPVN